MQCLLGRGALVIVDNGLSYNYLPVVLITMCACYLQGEWEHWSVRVEEYVYSNEIVPKFSSILVPNVDNVRTNFLMDTITKQNKVELLFLLGTPVYSWFCYPLLWVLLSAVCVCVRACVFACVQDI